MKKILTGIIAFAFICMFNSTTAQAAPQLMPDGQLFDPVFYGAKNGDVVMVCGLDPAALYMHYTTYGKNEGRLPYEGANPVVPVAPAMNMTQPELMLKIINNDRETQSLGKLEYDFELEYSAKIRAIEISDVYSHNRPDDTEYSTILPGWVRNDPRHFQVIGKGPTDAATMLSIWLEANSQSASALHDSAYNRAGISCHQGKDGIMYWAVILGYRKP